MKHPAFPGILCLAALLLAACQASPPLATRKPSAKVLQLNVWQEGTSVPEGNAKIAAAILASGADIVCFSEVRNYQGQDWHAKILAELKKQAPDRVFYGKFAGGDVGLISRFPIVDTAEIFNETARDTGSVMAWRLAMPGGGVWTVCSAHLDYKHYALNWVRGYNGGEPDFGMRDADRDGKPDRMTDADKIMAYNRQSRRDEGVAAFLAFAKAEQAAGRKVVLCGDFNEGSHLDWTGRAKDRFGHYGAVLSWDNSCALAEAGFRDGFRSVHPDEVRHPGFTWPATAFGKKTTSWAPLSDERDRMDFVYAGAGLKPERAWVVGPKTCFIGERKVEDPGEDPFLAADLPWPSDHKGVLVEVRPE